MKDCLFCKIINNEINSMTIYEDSLIKCFLDINPTTNGDLLIVPKKHYKDFIDIPNELLTHINNVSRNMYELYKKKLCCDGLTICHNLDYGQEIKHFHVHFIPRYKNDEVKHLSNKDILKPLEDIKKELLNE